MVWYYGSFVGSFVDLLVWSFYFGKNLGVMGDGGGVMGNDVVLLEVVCVCCNYGLWVKYYNEVKGWNLWLDEI